MSQNQQNCYTMSIFQKISSFISVISYSIFPVARSEMIYFFSLALLQSCLIISYTLARMLKDKIVMKAIGSAAINPIKFILVFPTALYFVYVYNQLQNRYSRQKVFFIVISAFLCYFLVFGLILYPLKDSLHFDAAPYQNWFEKFAEDRQNFKSIMGGNVGLLDKIWVLIVSFVGTVTIPLVRILSVWSFSIFYVIAEISGSVLVPLVFWTFANQTLPRNAQTRNRLIAVFATVSSIATAYSGYIAKVSFRLVGSEYKKLMIFLIVMWICLAAALIIYYCINYFGIATSMNPELKAADEAYKQKKQKPKISIEEALRIMKEDAYVRYLALIVLCYNASVVCGEVCYKTVIEMIEKGWHTTGEQGPGIQDFSSLVFGSQYVYIGASCLVLGYVLRFVLAQLTWGVAAMITPILLILTGISFFISLIFPITIQEYLGTSTFINGLRTLLSLPAINHELEVAVILGIFFIVCSKASKYVCFDATKEEAFNVLPAETMGKVKALLDVVGSRLGKSGLSGFQFFVILPITGQLIGTVTPNLIQAAPLLLLTFMLIQIIWVFSVIQLSKLYTEQVAVQSENHVAEVIIPSEENIVSKLHQNIKALQEDISTHKNKTLLHVKLEKIIKKKDDIKVLSDISKIDQQTTDDEDKKNTNLENNENSEHKDNSTDNSSVNTYDQDKIINSEKIIDESKNKSLEK